MRGKDPADSVIVEKIRITPAYAGKRIPSVLSDFKHRDHPRLCGEKHQFLHCLQGLLGSPPPMRGKERKSGVHRDSSRITPAYAGKSSGLWNREWKRKDHPRLCGEKLPTYIEAYLLSGITPAYAGKSISFRQSSHTHEDHPRLCGEKRKKCKNAAVQSGSPPPMRGKVVNCYLTGAVYRITPAYAGKSGINCNQIPVTGDHPRLCGEKDAIMHKIADIAGSPPPMRGKGKSSWRDN